MRTFAVLGAVLLVSVSIGVAGLTGYGPLAGVDGAPGTDDLPDPVGQDGDGGGGDDGGSGGGGGGTSGGDGTSGGGDGSGSAGTADDDGDSGPPFDIVVTSIEDCGRTCRDVTLAVTNERNETATGVEVVARLFAGKRDDDGDELWEGTASLGTLDPGESVTVERRVELGFVDAGRVKNDDGWVTVRTTVSGTDARTTFVSEEQVA